MYKEIFKLALLMLSLLSVMGSFLLFNRYYRKYYRHMKENHENEWWNLMKKDSLIETAGEWIRWPLGSTYLIASVFKLSETYNDQQVEHFKKKARLSFFIFILSFVMVILIAALFPRV
jgi:hypothetical protein